MPQRSKGARLWLKPATADRGAVWIIKDEGRRISTRCAASDVAGAERALSSYLIRKAGEATAELKDTDPQQVLVAEVLYRYLDAKGDGASRPKELVACVARLAEHFGDMAVGDLTQMDCRKFVEKRGGVRAGAHDLAYLKAAINMAYRDRAILHPVPVWMPPPPRPRERWLSRSEVARLLWACWRHKRRLKGGAVVYPRRHLAIYILMARYTGTRTATICSATLKPEPGRGWVDLDEGLYHRAAKGERITNKRKPPIRLPPPLLAHLRRWHANRPDQRFLIEWRSKPVRSIQQAWSSAREEAKLGEDVTPHVLRHTAITWAMQSGANKWEVAGYFGVSLPVIESVYAHHHPDHHGTVHKALSGGKRSRKRSRKSPADINSDA